MQLTIDQAQKIRLLSDGELYDKAVNFAKAHSRARISSSQLTGLHNALGAGYLKEVHDYIDNRLKRDTVSDEGKKFYECLKNDLDRLRELVEKTQLVVKPEEMGRAQNRQVREEINGYAFLLAREFIQHLIAEYNYQGVSHA